jgi:pimeloyl-[acyl-carrier protein] methyl ester esterase
MTMITLLRRGVLAAAISLAAVAAHAQPANKLFADSTLVERDRISVEVVGKGPDVILIPGLASSRETWKATAERLRGKHRLHLVQIAGFAGEPARANAEGDLFKPTAEAIGAYLADQGLAPATVVGHSLGGTISLYLAQAQPERLKKVMIVDALPFFGMVTSPTATPESVKPMAARMRDMMLASKTRATAAQLEPQMAQMSKDAATRRLVSEWGAASETSVVARMLYEDFTLDLRPGLPAIKTPIVLLYPDAVPVGMPPGMAQKVYTAAYAPAATVKPVLVENAAHFIMYDQPEVFARELDAFLASR